MKNKKLTKKEQKIVIMAGNFRTKLFKTVDDIKQGKTNYKAELPSLWANGLAELIQYTNLLMAGEFKKASNVDMDTSVREAIPETLYDAVYDCVNKQDIPAFTSKSNITYTDWKKEIIRLLVHNSYAVNINKAKHYLDEADSVTDADMGLKKCYKLDMDPITYISMGVEEGFWNNDEQKPFSKSSMGM